MTRCMYKDIPFTVILKIQKYPTVISRSLLNEVMVHQLGEPKAAIKVEE